MCLRLNVRQHEAKAKLNFFRRRLCCSTLPSAGKFPAPSRPNTDTPEFDITLHLCGLKFACVDSRLLAFVAYNGP